MEVADQWRREWAGTAEYGKVTEGGVTRRIARAMEVLHASGPGARVRVMRAAYHSTAGPGTPASSYMLHSSRRVISSGFNLLEPSSLPTKPLEISSTPLESSPDSNTEIENYKVTEPDDLEISEPSKWKSASRGSSIRMPSEESSSTDNASIIDLDTMTNHKNVFRKHSYDSDNSDVNLNKRNGMVSPLLDAPITLSTLKYKSLLNSSNEWNNRRKSYSFEDTSLDETIMQSTDTLAMESSTDSGICKSSEIVNDHVDDSTHSRYMDQDRQDESFKNWLSKNRSNSFYKGTKFKSHREHEIVTEDPMENNITLQSTGKVSITLPITVETSDGYRYTKTHVNEDSQRKVKKVEFCKTELHFAADTGKVNIIATDEKPPPSNDFRKRRSAFVPMEDMIEKPITLFGENINGFQEKRTSELLNYGYGEFIESDENTAATKSILKNKIPKPKPYLLGENMVFGARDDLPNKDYPYDGPSVLTAVSLINKRLQSEKQSDDEIKSSLFSETNTNSHKDSLFRIINKGPAKIRSLKNEAYGFASAKVKIFDNETADTEAVRSIKNISSAVQTSIQGRLKTRQLKESDLTYFGVNKSRKNTNENQLKYDKNRSSPGADMSVDDIFQSVRLIQQISNSVCNSESEDAPEYQNVPINTNYAPVPTPRIRSRLDEKPNENDKMAILKPIIEHESDEANSNNVTTSRRNKLRKHVESNNATGRSLSEPRKTSRNNSLGKPHRHLDRTSRCDKHHPRRENENVNKLSNIKASMHANKKICEDDSPSYINLNNAAESSDKKVEQNTMTNPRGSQQRELEIKLDHTKNHRNTHGVNSTNNQNYVPKTKITEKTLRRPNGENDRNSLHKKQQSLKKNGVSQQADKIDKLQGYTDDQKIFSKNKQEHKSRSLSIKDAKTAQHTIHSSENTSVAEIDNKDTKPHKREPSKDKTRSRYEFSKALHKLDTNSTIDKNSINRDLNIKLNTHRPSKRSEYVINYDDKNGTVSSICKIKSGSGAPRKKKISKEFIKEGPKENLMKNKTADIIALHPKPSKETKPTELCRQKMEDTSSCTKILPTVLV